MIAQAHDDLDRDPEPDRVSLVDVDGEPHVALDDRDANPESLDPVVATNADATNADAATTTRSRKGIGGPKTPEGKFRSAQNALKHGLRATVMLPDELAERAARRRDAMNAEFRPQSAYQFFLIEQAALAAVRVERCQEIERALIQRRVEAAETPSGWLAEARCEVEEIAAKLARDPARTVARLRKTTHGVNWLIQRWLGLGESLERHGGWNPAQLALARDLLGVPRDLRDPCAELPDDASPLEQGNLAIRILEELQHAQEEHLNEQDILDRARTSLGVPVRPDRELETIRRYERECRRTLRQTLDEFHRLRGESDSREELLKEAMMALLRTMPPQIRAQLQASFEDRETGTADAVRTQDAPPRTAQAAAPVSRIAEEWPVDDPLDEPDASWNDEAGWSDSDATEAGWSDSDGPVAADAGWFVGHAPDRSSAPNPDRRRARNRKRARARKREAARRRRSA